MSAAVFHRVRNVMSPTLLSLLMIVILLSVLSLGLVMLFL